MQKVPKRFTLGPHEWTVVWLPRKEMDAKAGTPVYGMTVFGELTIYLKKPDKHLRKEVQWHTFWHEYFHALFWSLGRMDENEDEVLVDQCGMLTAHALQTATY